MAEPGMIEQSGEGAEFVVVECIENLKSAQEELRQSMKNLDRRLRSLQLQISGTRATRRRVDDLWIVLWSFSVFVLPAAVAFIIHNKSAEDTGPAESVISLLVNMALFIGIPTYVSALYNAEIAPSDDVIIADREDLDDIEDDESEAGGDVVEAEEIEPFLEPYDENNNPAGDSNSDDY